MRLPTTNMKQLLVIISFFISIGSFAQRTLQENMRDLDIALVKKDTAFLNQYLHDNLSYGHSNGWIETKTELVSHLLNGKLSYTAIESKELSSEQTDQVAIVRSESKIKYLLDGKEGALNLHVLQVWVINGYKWQLLARQSTVMK
jgi:hypothetical protein